MQYKKDKTLHLTKVLGETVKELRIANTDKSMNRLEAEYDISRGNISRIERGKLDSQFSTVYIPLCH